MHDQITRLTDSGKRALIAGMAWSAGAVGMAVLLVLAAR